MGGSLTIRRPGSRDTDRIRELNEVALRQVGVYVEGADPDLEDIEGEYLETGGEFLVGEYEGLVVATGAYHSPSFYYDQFLGELPEHTAEITRMRVAPEYQGRGFGETIYDELERRARSSEIERLLLDTTLRQEAARNLYEKKGFREIEREEVDFGNGPMTMVFYEKAL